MKAIVRAGMLLLVLALLSPVLLPAQRPVSPPPAIQGVPDAPRFSLATDSRPAVVLEAIREHLSDANWDKLVPALQSVFDHGDTLITIQGGAVMTTARAEALRLFKELPKPGQEAYRQRYDALAREVIENARKEGDPKGLLEVLNRYEMTPSAGTALELLASQLAKSGRDAEAAAAFTRLQERQPLEKWSPEMVYRAAKSLARTETTPFAVQLGKRLLELGEKEGVTIDGMKIKPADLEAELKSWRAVPEVGMPMPVPTWTRRSMPLLELVKMLDDAAGALKARGEMIPAVSRPSVVRATVDGKERTVIVTRGVYGVQCLDAEKGDLLWLVTMPEDLVTWLRDTSRAALAQQWVSSHGPGSTALFDNTRTGRVSLGAEHVFVVADVPLLMKLQPQFPGMPAVQVPARVEEAIRRNLLQGISLKSGKLIWEVGGKGTPELDDGWFLGAPLVLGDTLLALHEKSRELRLVRLEAKTGKVLEVRSLGGLTQSLSEGDERRRGVQLVLARGHLLVPTGCGTLLGLELPTLRPSWVYEYGEAPEPEAVPIRPFRPIPVPLPAKPRPGYSYEPLTEGDLVVYSGPDTRRIHGLDVATGRRRWSVNAEENDRAVGPLLPSGLLVLGNSSLRLLNRTTGETIWKLAIPAPVGQGYVAGTRYVQPTAGQIVAIDLARGVITARLRTPPDLVPEGNLVPGSDFVTASGLVTVALLPQLENELRKLEKEADKPEGQAARVRLAEFELQRGRSVEALANVRRALEGKLEPDLVIKARDLLFRILTEHLQAVPADFARYQKEYLELANVLVPLDAPAGIQKQMTELRRERMRTALRVLAEGFLREKKTQEAVEKALELAMLEGPDLIDSPAGHPVARSVFAARILRSASEGNPEVVQAVLEQKTKALFEDKANLPALRKLLEAVPMGGAGDELHLRVARALLASDPAGADRILARLSTLGVPAVRAQAYYERFRLALKEGRLADAVVLARELAERFPNMVVTPADAEKKLTGKDVLDGVSTDKRLLPFLETPKLVRKWQATEKEEGTAGLGYRFWVALLNPGLPSESVPMQVDVNGAAVRIFEAGTDRLLGTVNQPPQRFMAEFQTLFPYFQTTRATRAGRVVLLSLAEQLVALDPVAAEVLWTKKRVDQAPGIQGFLPWVNQRLGWYQVRYSDGWTQIQGAPIASWGNVVVTPTQNGIEGLDIDTGRVLWQRRDLGAPCVLLVVGGKLLVIEYDNRQVRATHWLRIEDGSRTTGPDLSAAFTDAIQVQDGYLLVVGKKEGPVLRVVELATGRELWSKELPAESVVLESKVPGLFGWVEPKGELHLFDLATQAEQVNVTLEKVLRAIQGGTLLADGRNYYLLTQAKDPKPDNLGVPPNLFQAQTIVYQPSMPVQVVPGTGHLIAFDRASKKLAWYTETPGQSLGMPAEDLPVVILAAVRVGAGVPARSSMELRLLDRRTGKIIYDRTSPTVEQLNNLRWQPAEATLELIGMTRRVKVVPE
jgi:outer membrane protein assembly factor BamB